MGFVNWTFKLNNSGENCGTLLHPAELKFYSENIVFDNKTRFGPTGKT
jgi:hypothetical protein